MGDSKIFTYPLFFTLQNLKNKIECSNASDDERVQALSDKNAIHHRISEYQSLTESMVPGLERSRVVHQLLDEQIKQANQYNDTKPSCKKGCSFCCHQNITVTAEEADLLADRVKNGVKIDMDRLKKQTKFFDKDQWIGKSPAVSACVFLDDKGTCRIYEDRPSFCRKYQVISDPKKCSLHKKQNVAVINNFEVEIITTAYMRACHNTVGPDGPLPKLMLERLAPPSNTSK